MTVRSLLVITLLLMVPHLHGCAPAVTAGAGAAVLVTGDRRTSGAYVEDENIQVKADNAMKKEFGNNDKVHINVASYNRYVLLTGEVPTEEIKKQAGVTALGIVNVRNVQNELVIGPVASFSQQATDAYTTSKVKARFVTDGKFSANHVKVITDDNTVYLMGLVTKKEADDATELARTTSGVTKVVRVFELTD